MGPATLNVSSYLLAEVAGIVEENDSLDSMVHTNTFSSRSNKIRRFEGPPSGENIAGINPSENLCIWDASTGRIFREVGLLATELRCLAWSSDSRRIAIGSDVATIIYDVEDLRKGMIGDHSGLVYSPAWVLTCTLNPHI